MRFRQSIAMLMLLGSPLSAQESIRIGYVDMKQLLDNAPQIALNREALDQEFRPRSEAIGKDEERLQQMQEELQNQTGDSSSLQNRIRNLQLSINRRREDLRQEILFRRNMAIQELEDDINQAVATVARNRSYDLIISNPVIYANDRVDLTSEVLDYLKAQLQMEQ